MPNRILKESICLNRKIDRLTDFQENLFYRLIVKVDDYGIYLADPAILASTLYPRKRGLSLKVVTEALQLMAETGLIRLYESGGEAYLKIVSWERHQRMRSSVHRFPMPEEDTAAEGEETAEEAGSAGPGEAPETEPAELPSAGEAAEAAQEAEVRELPVIELPLNDGSAFGVTREEIGGYAKLYPAVDVEQELRNMLGWCMANPAKRKTRSGIRRFIAGWLAREQNRGGTAASVRLPPGNPFIQMAAEADGGGGYGGGGYGG